MVSERLISTSVRNYFVWGTWQLWTLAKWLSPCDTDHPANLCSSSAPGASRRAADGRRPRCKLRRSRVHGSDTGLSAALTGCTRTRALHCTWTSWWGYLQQEVRTKVNTSFHFSRRNFPAVILSHFSFPLFFAVAHLKYSVKSLKLKQSFLLFEQLSLVSNT